MPDDQTTTTEDTQSTTEEVDLSDAGKRALDAERNKARTEERSRKAAEKKLGELEARLAEFDAASQTEHEKALATARKEAAAAATAEATTKANRRILTAEIKAAAGTRLADPADAVRLLDLDSFEVDEDGEVDSKALQAAIDDLLKSKPYLAANGTKALPPSADGGARPNGNPAPPDTVRGLITAGLEANDKARARR